MRGWWKRKLKAIRLSRRLLITYALFAGISCLISMSALQMCLNIYDSKLYEKSLQELDFFTQQVNIKLAEIEKLSASIAMDQEVQKQLTKLQDVKYMSAEYSLGLYHIRELIMDELIAYPYVQNVIYTDGRQGSVKAGMDTGAIAEKTQKELLSRFQEERGGYVWQNPTASYPYLLSGRDVLERKNASLDYLGSLIFTCDISRIIGEMSESLEAEHAFLYVYSKDGTIYQDEGETQLLNIDSAKTDSGYKIVRYQGKRYFRCHLRSGANGWTYVNVFPYSEIFGQIRLVRVLLFGAFLILFVCMVLVIHENYEKQLLLQDTRYKMLQAQINPHFLYNTLNTLHWMVRGGKNKDACRVIVELGQLLRASFARDPYTTVKQELDTARGYMVIQEYRYKNRAQFEILAEGELEDCRIPRMILQPLIENAINYGVDNSLEICKITVCAREEGEGILLSVEDTGPGMSAQELAQVRDGTVVPKGHGIGVKNIRERLKIAFENSEFEISSTQGEGTRVLIRIPKVKAEAEDV